MRLGVSLLDLRYVQLRVDLGRRDAGMTEEFLNRTQIRPAFEKVHRIAVAQRVGSGRLPDARFLGKLSDAIENALPA